MVQDIFPFDEEDQNSETCEDKMLTLPYASAYFKDPMELLEATQSMINILDDPMVLNDAITFSGPMGTRTLLDLLTQLKRYILLAGPDNEGLIPPDTV